MQSSDGGPYYEDFKVGSTYKSRAGRTLTDTDNIWFSLLTNNSNQIHFNLDYVKKNYPGRPFNGRLVVNGFLTLATVVGLMVEFTSSRGFMLSLDNAKFSNPVFSGDTIYAEAEIMDKRESKTRKGFGVVSIKTTGRNQDGETVVTFDRKFMIPMRGRKWKGEKEGS